MKINSYLYKIYRINYTLHKYKDSHYLIQSKMKINKIKIAENNFQNKWQWVTKYLSIIKQKV